MRLSAWLCTLALLAPALTAACGGAPEKPAIEPGPAIPGLNLSGKWYSREFGDMTLTQTGKEVRGRYEDPRGPDHNGTVKGVVQGDLLRVEWIKAGNPLAAIMPMRGKAYFRVARDGKKLEGRWGYDTADDDGGVWNAEKSNFQ